MSSTSPAVERKTIGSLWIGVALGIATLVFAVFAILGLSVWLFLAVASLGWLIYLRARVGSMLAVSLTGVGGLALVLFTLMVSRPMGTGILFAVVVVSAVMGLGGALLLTFGRNRIAVPDWRATVIVASSLLGVVVWFAALVVADVRASAAHISWVMLGDSANNILFGRHLIADHGIAVGSGANPVPLPAGLLALGMASARRSGTDELLRVDLGAFAQLWMLLIAATCVLAGLVASRFVTRKRPILAAATGAGASLLPLTWFVTGYPLEYGFFNSDIVLPVVLVCVLAYVESRLRPAAALIVLLLAATVLLATWGPLVLVPAALGIVILVRDRRALLAERGWMLTAIIVSIVQLLAYGVGVTLPTLLSSGDALASPGAAYPVSKALVGLLAGLVLLAAVVRYRLVRDRALSLVLTLGASFAIGLGILLFSNRHAATIWGYYPLKFLWLASVVLLVVGVGLLGSLVAELVAGAWLTVLAAVATVVLFGTTLGALNSVDGYDGRGPIERIMDGKFFGQGDATLDRLVKLADQSPPNVFWKSGDPMEAGLNFWLLQTRAGLDPKNFDLRYAAYVYKGEDVDELCKIVGLMGGDVRVHTADPQVPVEVSETCPEYRVTFVQN